MEEFYEVIDKNYRYLLDYYTIDHLKSRLRYWLKRTESVVADCGLDEKVILNRTAVYYFICDYFADIVRLKEFHPIENTNLKKILAYGAYWFLRKHPVQFIVDSVTTKELYINEKIVISAIVGCIKENGGISDEDLDISLLEHFFYALKYRVYTAQTIELFIDGVMRGKDLVPKKETA